MGKQSARLYYQGKDHKDIYFQGKYHKAMYLGNKLLWKKMQKIIPYVSFDGDSRAMCIKLLFVDDKFVKKITNLVGEAFSNFRFVRGDNAVGYFLKDATWIFSKDGQHFFRTGKLPVRGGISGFLGYALTKDYFLGVTQKEGDYTLFCRDIGSYAYQWSDSFGQFSGLVSGYINPKLDYYIEHTRVGSNADRYALYDANHDASSGAKTIHAFDYFNEVKFLGVSNSTMYVFQRSYVFAESYIEEYDYVNGSGKTTNTDIAQNFYFNIMETFYENGKFIVYCSENGKLQIYETIDFKSFTSIETPQSIKIKDMDSGGEYEISFDSSVIGDVYLQPYCTLDNTFYFDEDGTIHDDTGCLFTYNINEDGHKTIVLAYFDNHYFRQSDNNFCQILIFEEEDIEGPLFE